MSLQGTIIRLPNNGIGFEYTTTEYNSPRKIRQVWQLASWRTRGMSYATEDESIGKPATISDGRVSCYLGNGNYLYGELENGGQTESIVCEVTDVRRPKVKTGIETRWRNGQWEKLLKTGWKAA